MIVVPESPKNCLLDLVSSCAAEDASQVCFPLSTQANSLQYGAWMEQFFHVSLATLYRHRPRNGRMPAGKGYVHETSNACDDVEALSSALASFDKLVRGTISKTTQLGDSHVSWRLTEASRAMDHTLRHLEAYLQVMPWIRTGM
jgi:hypothetical protein